MFLTSKISRVITSNDRLDSRQTILLQCIYFKRSWYKSFIFSAIALGATSFLVYSYRLMPRADSRMRGFIALGAIVMALLFFLGLIELLLYITKRKLLLEIYGEYPNRLEIVVVNGIDKILKEGSFPPEYYAIDWDMRISKYSEKKK